MFRSMICGLTLDPDCLFDGIDPWRVKLIVGPHPSRNTSDDSRPCAPYADQRLHHYPLSIIQPFRAAASIIAYSPDTWYAASGTSNLSRAAAITSR